MRRQRAGYSLHLMTADGGGSHAGSFPTRSLAEAMGETLKALGSCLCYDVIAED